MMGEHVPGAGFGQSPAATAPVSDRPVSESDGSVTLWDSDGFGFGDLLDVINPLQQLPVVSTLYRELSGDDIGHAARVLGGALYGGPIGAVVSFANTVLDEISGDDIGGHALALLKDAAGIDEPSGDDGVMVADANGDGPQDDAPAPGRSHDDYALANAVDDGDHLLVARRVHPGTMSESPGYEYEWVRVPKPAGGTVQGAEPAAAMPAEGSPAALPSPPRPETGGPPARSTGDTTGPFPGTDTADAGPAEAARDPLLSEAERLFRLGLQYEPGSDWARPEGGEGEANSNGSARRDEAADASSVAKGGAWVSDAMRQGLDKYQAMIRDQAAPGRPLIDVDL